MHTLISAGPKFDLFSLIIFIIIFTVLIGGVYLFVLLKERIVHGKYYVAERAKAETICSWEYSAAEWQKYAGEFELGKNPKGAATVRITPLDLWFTDENETLRKPIYSGAMMVTDCRYSNNLLKIRIRSCTSSARTNYYGSHDFLIPVPAAKTQEAATAVEYFKKIMAQQPKKILYVTPPATNIGLFGETDF